MKTWEELAQLESPLKVMLEANERQLAILALITASDMSTTIVMLKLYGKDLPEDSKARLFYLAPYIEANFIEVSDDELKALALAASMAAIVKD